MITPRKPGELLVTVMPQAKTEFGSAPTVVNLIEALTPEVGEKDGLAVCFCTLREEEGDEGVYVRRAVNVTHITAFALDLDGYTTAAREAALDRVESSGVAHIWYESFSQGTVKKDAQGPECLRIVFPFEDPLPYEGIDWKASYDRMAKHFGFGGEDDPAFADKYDAACTDPARLFFTPRHPPGQTREVYYDFSMPFFDPSPCLVKGGGPGKKVRKPLNIVPDGQGLAVERADICARLEGAVSSARLKKAAAKVTRGEALGGSSDSCRGTYRGLSMALAPHLKEDESTEAVAKTLYEASYDTDLRLNPSIWPFDNLVDALEDARRNNTPEDLAEYRAKRDAGALKIATALARIQPRQPPKASGDEGEEGEEDIEPEGPYVPVDEHIDLGAAVPQPSANRGPRVPLSLLHLALPTKEDADGNRAPSTVFPDEKSAIMAINNAAECPIPFDSNGDCLVAEWCPRPTQRDPEARVFKPVTPLKFAAQLKGFSYRPRGDAEAKPKSVAELWLAQTHLRKVGIICSADKAVIAAHPNALQLWRGFTVRQIEGDVQPWLDVVKHLANGDRLAEQDFVKWCAWKIQNPCTRPEVALMLQGPQGCGKTFVLDSMRYLFGEHARLVTHIEGLTGRFNAPLAGACLIGAEEVSLERDSDNERVKSIITSDTLDIQPKGVDIFEVPNTAGLIMCTNKHKGLRVEDEDEERRWLVLKAPETNPHPRGSTQHRALWRPRYSWRDNGGLEHLAHYLASLPLWVTDPTTGEPERDATGKPVPWHPRDIGTSRGLRDEGAQTRERGPAGWIAEVAENRVVWIDGSVAHVKDDGSSWFPTYELETAYGGWCRGDKAREAAKANRQKLGMALAKAGWRTEKRTVPGAGRRPGYCVPAIP